MDLPCPHCDGAGHVRGRRERCWPCRGRGQLHLSRRQRQDLALQLIEGRAHITTPAERLALGVVAKAVHDLGTPNDSTAEVLGGALAPYLGILGVGEEWAFEVLADAHLIYSDHSSRPEHPAEPAPGESPG